MTLKNMSNKKLAQITNAFSREAFQNSYTYPIIFDDVKYPQFYTSIDVPKGHENECAAYIPAKLRKKSLEQLTKVLLNIVYKYNMWWRGYDYNVNFYFSNETIAYYSQMIENM